ncbi:MAG: hypothetical protein V2A64_07915 [Candidatus Omnitrophota bacterium]
MKNLVFMSLGYEIREKYGYTNKYFVSTEEKNSFYHNITIDSTLSRSIFQYESFRNQTIETFSIIKDYKRAKKIWENIALIDSNFNKEDFSIYLYNIRTDDKERLQKIEYFKKNKDRLLLLAEVQDIIILGYDVATFDTLDNNWYSELCNEGFNKNDIEARYGLLNSYSLFEDISGAELFFRDLSNTDSEAGQTFIVQICSVSDNRP